MKTIIFGIAIVAVAISSCGNNANQSNEAAIKNPASTATNTQTNKATGQQPASFNEMLTTYLQIKNALANDNGEQAAAGGDAFVASIGKVDKSSMTAEQKQAFEDAADDAKEMAEHISKSADKIEHQREHFDMLSQDMYDLVKAFGSGQTLYKDFCPMYNNNKGAAWLSETKEIKNPYLGQKMLTCGEVQEEIKK